MESSQSSVNKGVEHAEQAGEVLSELNGAISRLEQMNAQISTAANEQSEVAEMINSNVHSINEVAEKTAATSNKNLTASEELNAIARHLQDLVGQFRV